MSKTTLRSELKKEYKRFLKKFYEISNSYVSSASDLKDFENRIDEVDELTLEFLDKLDTLPDDIYNKHYEKFISQEYIATAHFQYGFIPVEFFNNPSLFIDEMLPTTTSKSVIKEFNKRAPTKIKELESNITSKLHKQREFNIVEIDFNFTESQPANLYHKLLLPYQINI